MNDNEIPCPLCNKVFLKSVIEEHASRCLFLHDSSNYVESPKRENPFVEQSPLMKRMKQDQNKSDQGTKKNSSPVIKKTNMLAMTTTYEVIIFQI